MSGEVTESDLRSLKDEFFKTMWKSFNTNIEISQTMCAEDDGTLNLTTICKGQEHQCTLRHCHPSDRRIGDVHTHPNSFGGLSTSDIFGLSQDAQLKDHRYTKCVLDNKGAACYRANLDSPKMRKLMDAWKRLHGGFIRKADLIEAIVNLTNLSEEITRDKQSYVTPVAFLPWDAPSMPDFKEKREPVTIKGRQYIEVTTHDESLWPFLREDREALTVEEFKERIRGATETIDRDYIENLGGIDPRTARNFINAFKKSYGDDILKYLTSKRPEELTHYWQREFLEHMYGPQWKMFMKTPVTREGREKQLDEALSVKRETQARPRPKSGGGRFSDMPITELRALAARVKPGSPIAAQIDAEIRSR